jgi:hypothetical protein
MIKIKVNQELETFKNKLREEGWKLLIPIALGSVTYLIITHPSILNNVFSALKEVPHNISFLGNVTMGSTSTPLNISSNSTSSNPSRILWVWYRLYPLIMHPP